MIGALAGSWNEWAGNVQAWSKSTTQTLAKLQATVVHMQADIASLKQARTDPAVISQLQAAHLTDAQNAIASLRVSVSVLQQPAPAPVWDVLSNG